MIRLLMVAALLLTSWAALAAPPPNPPPFAVVGGNASLAVTASSARVALPASVVTFPAIVVVNVGTKEAFVKCGTSSVTAATTDLSVPAGAIRVIYAGACADLAAIAGGSDSTTLRIAQTNGAPLGWGGP